MTSGPKLERSLLEAKERDELQTIAQAMSIKTNARASKSTLIGAILEATGVEANDGSSNGAAEAPDTAPRRSVIRSSRAGNGAAADPDHALEEELSTVSVAAAPAPAPAAAAPAPAEPVTEGAPDPLEPRGPRPHSQQQAGFDPANRRNNRRRRGRDRERGDRDLQGAQ